jgi:hypothetical protein
MNTIHFDRLNDGDIIEISLTNYTFNKSNILMNVASEDELVLKTPTERFYNLLQKVYIQKATLVNSRPARENEDFEFLKKKYVQYEAIENCSDNLALYTLLLLANQYSEICNENIASPETKFIIIYDQKQYYPCVIQKRIIGKTIWELYYNGRCETINSDYNYLIPLLSDYFENLLSKNYENVSMSIQNFIIDETGKNVYYIDNSPTSLITSNPLNISQIKRSLLKSGVLKIHKAEYTKEVVFTSLTALSTSSILVILGTPIWFWVSLGLFVISLPAYSHSKKEYNVYKELCK